MCGGESDPGECSNCRAGILEIVECPLERIPVRIWRVVRYAGLYEKGLPPVAGGALDQTAVFLAACGFIAADREEHKAKILEGLTAKP